MHKPLISVIVPVYNVREYLPDTLRSIRNSDYENLEVILVDDGSTDGSGFICNTYARNDERFKVIHKARGGVSSARNAGLEIACGEWIAFCDGDDVIEPTMYSYLLKKAMKHSADIVQCGIYFEDEDGNAKKFFCPACDVAFKTHSKSLGKYFLKLFSYSCFSKLFRKSAVESVKFDESCSIGEDLRFGLDALENSYKIVFAGKPMYHYIQRDGSAIHSITENGHLMAFNEMIKKAEDNYSNHPILNSVTRRITLLNYTDICSKIVIEDIPDTELLFNDIREDIKRSVFFIIFASKLPVKEKCKLLAIGFLPEFYKKQLLKKKAKMIKEEAKEAAEETMPSEQAEAAESIEAAESLEPAAEPAVANEEEAALKPAPEPISDEERNQIQSQSFKALKEIKRICENHELRYYLTAGTLLGSVRHGGFIPWDDDIDIIMPRSDYNEFAKIVKEELSEGFFYQDERTEAEYPFYFAKLRVDGLEVNEPVLENSLMHNGCYVDIFPLDACPTKESRAIRFFRIMQFVQSVLIAKYNSSFECQYQKKSAINAFNIAKRLPRSILLFFRHLVRVYYALTSKKGRVCTVGGSYGYPRETYSSEWFKKIAIGRFERQKFVVPYGWDELLTSMYGNYMTPPEESERVGHFTK